MRVNSPPPPLRGGANAGCSVGGGRTDEIFVEDEDEKQRKAIQRLCDLSDQIDQARDANQFPRAIELMREQVRLFRVQATMSEEEREAMEPLIQSALEEIEEMRGKVQREEEST